MTEKDRSPDAKAPDCQLCGTPTTATTFLGPVCLPCQTNPPDDAPPLPPSDIDTTVLVRGTLRMLEDGDAFVELTTGEHIKIPRGDVQRTTSAPIPHDLVVDQTVEACAALLDEKAHAHRSAAARYAEVMRTADSMSEDALAATIEMCAAYLRKSRTENKLRTEQANRKGST